MDSKEFKSIYRVPDMIIETLDWLYLNFTKDQALDMIDDYFANADDIWNSIKHN